MGINVRTVQGGVAACAPAGALAEEGAVVNETDVELAGSEGGRSLDLGVATQAQIGVRINQQFGIHRAMRLVARGASFPQSGMFEHHGTSLRPVALGTSFVQSSHGEPAFGFMDIAAVRIVALDAVHPPFLHRMMPGQAELRMHIQMTTKTTGRIFARVRDEYAPSSARFDVFAARAMAGLASGATSEFSML